MTMTDKNGIKSFFISLSLHFIVTAAFFYLIDGKSIVKKELAKPIVISLKSFELPIASKPQKSEISKEIIKKQEVKKSVEKMTEQNIHAQGIAPLQEVLKPTQEEFIEENKEIALTQNDTLPAVDNTTKSIESMQNEFIKTNFHSIRNKVLANLKYPNRAKRMGLEGYVEVALVIDTSGKLLDVVLEKSSGYEVLDNSAIKAVGELYTHTLPIPQIISRVTLPIHFTLH